MRLWAIAAVGLLAGCSDGAPQGAKKAAKADALQAGEYVMTAKVTALRSTDGTTPLTQLKLGDENVIKGCIAADGALDPALFAETGDACTATNSYVRGGKLSVQLSCAREGAPGQVLPAVDGQFTADSFDGTVVTITYLTGPGDYSLTRSVTAKRVGECRAAQAPVAV